MIIPTQRAVILTALAAPAALAAGVLAPGGWAAALLWVLAMLLLVAIDGARVRAIGDEIAVSLPAALAVGDRLTLAPALADGAPAMFAAEATAPLVPEGRLRFVAERRGTARLTALWARRRGPMGLAWRQRRFVRDDAIRILADVRGARDEGMRHYLASARHGARMRIESGEGQEFQALTDFQPGMQRRAIDWKATARHRALLAREYRTERDHEVVLAIDAGRTMSDPLAGMPRVDRAVAAALLAATVALKAGDRVRLFAFDGRPLVDSGTVAGPAAFARLATEAAAIDYGQGESNHTLALATLDQRLRRRSLIVLFTEFADPTAAELLIAAGRRLLKRHRVLFVLFDDAELAEAMAATPENGDAIVRANVAHVLHRERRVTIERVRRLGIDVIEAPHDALPLAVVERYLSLRERG